MNIAHQNSQMHQPTMRLSPESGTAVIAEKKLRLSVITPPMKDGTTLLIEATSNLADQHKQKLFPPDLNGISGSMIPRGLDILIFDIHAKTPGLRHVSFQNLSHGRCIKLCVNFQFKDWAYRLNLIHFSEEFRSLVENSIHNCHSATMDRDEYGTCVWFQISLEPNDDCYLVFRQVDEQILALYKKALSKADVGFVTKLGGENSTGDAGYRWWIRYVAVPLISGGVGAAMIGWALSRL